jgi:maleylacetoacetate isomerase
MVACEIHPLNNLRVLKHLTGPMGQSESAKSAWIHHWIHTGLTALETRLVELGAKHFCWGDRPSLADACLVPQVFNAMRFEVDLEAYPTVRRIHDHCMGLEAFDRAQPSRCPDASA